MMDKNRSNGHGNRLAPRNSERIDRDQAIHFQFDGRQIKAFKGDTIASALLADGQRELSRSFKYHRKRGLYCASGDCPNCLVQVGSEPNVRACRRRVQAGMVVRSQNRWPSLSFDLLHLTDFLDPFLPTGFYYKAFLKPKFLWPLYEKVLRHIAGLGRVDRDSKPQYKSKTYLHAEVVVLGGGPAGVQAALSAAAEGARVLLIDENDQLGGHLRYGRGQWNGSSLAEFAKELSTRAEQNESIELLTGANVFGWYEDNWLSAAQGDRLFKIRGGSVVLATGAREQPLVFQNNDLPGVMLSGAAQRLIRLWAVKPGTKAVVVAPHRMGWQTALDLHEAGIQVEMVANPAGEIEPDIAEQFNQLEIPYSASTTIKAVHSRRRLRAVELVESGAHTSKRVNCDLLIASSGFSPASELLLQAGGETHWDQATSEHLPSQIPPGVFVAGDVSGPMSLSETLHSAKAAGQQAAAFANRPQESAHSSAKAADSAVNSVRSISPIAPDPAKKSFVCFCEDVTRKDIKQSIEEGYDSLELLKRYSTVSMGPCQGKMCNLASIHLCALDNNRSIPETGKTTARPPVRPVSLGALAGPPMEPVRRTPIHDWHIQQNARMMVAGDWLRPEHYGDPVGEVQAVRTRVGLIDVSTLGKYHLHGPDAAELLERIYTNRWRGLKVGRVRYGLMTNEEGIVLDDGVTARLEDHLYYLTTTSSGATSAYEWIQWWLQSGWNLDVHLENATEYRAAMNLTGPLARRVLQPLVGDADLSPEAFPYMHCRQLDIAGVSALVLRIGFTGELGFEIHIPSGYGMAVWQTLMEAGEDYGIEAFGVEAQRVLRLEKAHLIVGQDTDSLTDPFEAGMSWAVKSDKPDFLGRAFLKEINEAGPSRQLVGFSVPTGIVPAEASQVVRRDEGDDLTILGRVTSARWSPTLDKAIGLAWLPANRSETGASFTIRTERGLVEAVVEETPFYDPDGSRLKA